MTNSIAFIGAGRPASFRYRIEHRTGNGTSFTYRDRPLGACPFALREGRMTVPPMRADLEWRGKRTHGVCLEEQDFCIGRCDQASGIRNMPRGMRRRLA